MIRGAWVVPVALALGLAPIAAFASDRYALVVSGASGAPQYAAQYDTWRTSLVDTLSRGLSYPQDHLLVLAEREADGVGKATRENVRRALSSMARRATGNDLVLIVLIGHGTGTDGDDAKFNLVGPDLNAREWADLVRPLAGRVVFVNTASGSFPFLEALSGHGRIVVTANDSAAQQYETVFPGDFVKALAHASADLDKNGRVSIWEAFAAASAGVRRWYEERGQLVTERALLDDSGDGVGQEADGVGRDGPVAMVTYLQSEPPIPETGNPELTSLLRRRADLEAALERLRARKSSMRADEYQSALERILVEIAQVDRRIRAKS